MALLPARSLTLDGTPSVRLANLSARHSSSSAISAVSSVGGVDGWADDAEAEADGFDAEAPPAQVDPAVAARAMEHASQLKGVDGFDLQPQAKPGPPLAPATPGALTPAPSAAAARPVKLRIEQGGPSDVAVVSVMCRLAKIKRPGQLYYYQEPRDGIFIFGDNAVDLPPGAPRLQMHCGRVVSRVVSRAASRAAQTLCLRFGA